MFSDWLAFYWPQLRNPFAITPGVYNLPWLFVALQPLRLLGPIGSAIAVQVFSLVILVLVCRQEQIRPARFALIVVSPVAATHVFFGQLDGLLLIALLAPAPIRIGLSIAKPQTLFPIWLDALRRSPTVALTLSIALIGTSFLIWRWPFAAGVPAPPFGWNFSAWPISLLLAPLVFHPDKRFSWLIAPFAFPYVGVASLWLPLLAAAKMRSIWPLLLLWLTLALRLAVMLTG